MTSTTSDRTVCFTCNKEKITYFCQGCLNRFCLNHLNTHRQNLHQELGQIQTDHDQLRQNLNEEKSNPDDHGLIKQIDQWEKNSIEKIKQTAQQCRLKWTNYSDEYLDIMEKKINDFAQQIKQMNAEDEFNEIDLNHLKEKLEKLEGELHRPNNVSIKEQSSSFIAEISLLLPLHKDTRWKPFGTTIAGGNGQGNRLNQLARPLGICFDHQKQTIYVADYDNHRIVARSSSGDNDWIVAGGNGKGNRIDQLNEPTDVIIDQEDNSLIITDQGNRRVVRWSREKREQGQIIIEDIDCWGLAMHTDGSLYVSDWKKNEVRRWKKGDVQGTVAAGGSELNFPSYLFVDDDHTLYITDSNNYRVMKWMKNRKEGIVVAGGNGRGSQITQLSYPRGIVVDRFGHIYVSDHDNSRVMRWCEGAKEGMIIVGGNGKGQEANQLTGPYGLSLDEEGNLFVADLMNHRVQKFEID